MTQDILSNLYLHSSLELYTHHQAILNANRKSDNYIHYFYFMYVQSCYFHVLDRFSDHLIYNTIIQKIEIDYSVFSC